MLVKKLGNIYSDNLATFYCRTGKHCILSCTTKNRGQSLIEYVMLASIIILGIIIAGPTLVRAVQGYFKIVDDSIQDSASENIQQTPIASSGAGRACACSIDQPFGTTDNPLKPDTWPPTSCNVGACSVTQRYHYRTCTPVKCGQEEACVADNTCCTDLTPVSCGMTLPDNCTSRNQPNDHLSPLSGTCLGTNDCAIGERTYKMTCGDPTGGPNGTITYYGCKEAPEVALECLPSCAGTFPGSTSCTANNENDNFNTLSERQSLIDELIWRMNPTAVDKVIDKILEIRPYPISGSLDPATDKNAYTLSSYYLLPADCRESLYCERKCPPGFAPSSDHSTCIQIACWYGWMPQITSDPLPQSSTKQAHKACASTLEPKICHADNKICGYLALCSGSDGLIASQASNSATVELLAQTQGTCKPGEKKITDPNNQKTYCYKITPNSSAIAPPTQTFSCSTLGDLNPTLLYVLEGCSDPVP